MMNMTKALNSNLPKVQNQKLLINQTNNRSLSSSGQKILAGGLPNSQLIKNKMMVNQKLMRDNSYASNNSGRSNDNSSAQKFI